MRFLVLSVTAGNGHNAMGNAVIECLKKDGHETKIVDYLRPSTKIRAKVAHEWYFWFLKTFPHTIDKIYDNLLKRDTTKKSKVSALTYMTSSKKANKNLEKQINDFKPDFIYCTHLYTAYLVSKLKEEGKLKNVKSFFIVSDYELIPYIEFTTHNDYVLTPSLELHEKLLNIGFKEEQLLPFGITVNTKFSVHKDTKENTRISLGLDPTTPTFLIMNGGVGFGNTLKLIKELEQIQEKFQLIIVNGKNKKMKNKIDKYLEENKKIKCLNIGFANNVDVLMDACDLLIGKIGGVAVAEAFNKGLPILVAGNAPFQEWSNVIFLGEKNAILYAKDEKETKNQLEDLLKDPSKLERMKENVFKIAKPNATIDFASFMNLLTSKVEN